VGTVEREPLERIGGCVLIVLVQCPQRSGECPVLSTQARAGPLVLSTGFLSLSLAVSCHVAVELTRLACVQVAHDFCAVLCSCHKGMEAKSCYSEYNALEKMLVARCQWLMPVILATWEAEIGRITF
jgi:hypothetical protein